jgi:hypothetical protein
MLAELDGIKYMIEIACIYKKTNNVQLLSRKVGRRLQSFQ